MSIDTWRQQMTMNLKRLLTTDDVCELLGLPSRASLYSTRYRGEPPGSLAIRVGKYLRWDPYELDVWLEDLKVRRRSNWDGAKKGSSDVPSR
jgi:predicted DNA-binding transcriptional regulator AlpA